MSNLLYTVLDYCLKPLFSGYIEMQQGREHVYLVMGILQITAFIIFTLVWAAGKIRVRKNKVYTLDHAK